MPKMEHVISGAVAGKHLRMCASFEQISFKKNAFLRAADSVESLGDNLKNYYPDRFKTIPGVGDSTAKILKDLFELGVSVRTEVAKIDLEKKGMIVGDTIKVPVEAVAEMLESICSGMCLFDHVVRVVAAGELAAGEKFISKASFTVEMSDLSRWGGGARWFLGKGDAGVISPADHRCTAEFGDMKLLVELNFIQKT